MEHGCFPPLGRQECEKIPISLYTELGYLDLVVHVECKEIGEMVFQDGQGKLLKTANAGRQEAVLRLEWKQHRHGYEESCCRRYSF